MRLYKNKYERCFKLHILLTALAFKLKMKKKQLFLYSIYEVME